LVQLIKLVVIVSLFTIATACNEDEKEKIPSAAPGTMCVNFHGVQVTNSTTSEVVADFTPSTAELNVQGWFQTKDVVPVESTYISIYLKNAKTGQFEIKGNLTTSADTHYIFYSINSGKETYYSWLGPESVAGKVTIKKLDTTNKLASGSFEVKLYNDAAKMIELTEGSFTDIRIY